MDCQKCAKGGHVACLCPTSSGEDPAKHATTSNALMGDRCNYSPYSGDPRACWLRDGFGLGPLQDVCFWAGWRTYTALRI